MRWINDCERDLLRLCRMESPARHQHRRLLQWRSVVGEGGLADTPQPSVWWAAAARLAAMTGECVKGSKNCILVTMFPGIQCRAWPAVNLADQGSCGNLQRKGRIYILTFVLVLGVFGTMDTFASQSVESGMCEIDIRGYEVDISMDAISRRYDHKIVDLAPDAQRRFARAGEQELSSGNASHIPVIVRLNIVYVQQNAQEYRLSFSYRIIRYNQTAWPPEWRFARTIIVEDTRLMSGVNDVIDNVVWDINKTMRACDGKNN